MLSEGYHTLNISLPGYDSEKKVVYVSRKTLKSIKIVLTKSSYPIGNNDIKEVTPLTNSITTKLYDQDYFYYPRKEFQDIKLAHPRHFDIYR